MRQKLIVGSRSSALALWQTEHVVERLQAIAPGLTVEIKTIRTHGDRVRDRALSQVGGKGLFVKEIEAALLSGEIDLAVHSLKDMPTAQPRGLALGAILKRADPHDALVVRVPDVNVQARRARPFGLVSSREGDWLSQHEGSAPCLATLPAGARVGTSSLRRRAQLLATRPDLQMANLRGNVDTRLRKLREGQYDAIVLAAAGLLRLGHADTIGEILPVDVMLPAVGQGALCVEIRDDDDGMHALVVRLDHAPTRQATAAEQAFLRRLGGGCQVPIGAYAEVRNEHLHLRGLVASLDGSRVVRDEVRGPVTEADRLGAELAERVLTAGGEAILEELRRGS